MANNYLPVGDMALLGAGAGGILGGLYAPKGKTMRRILGGAAVGGLGGAGMAAGNNLTSGMFEGVGSSEPTIPNVVLPKLVGLGGAYTGLHLGNKAYREFEEDLEGKKKDKPKKEKAVKEKEKTASVEKALFNNVLVPRTNTMSTTNLPPEDYKSISAVAKRMLLSSLAGAGVGGLAGAYSAEKGKKFKGALRGASFGAPVGLFANEGLRTGTGFSDIALSAKPYNELSGGQKTMHLAAPYAGAGLGALIGTRLGHQQAEGMDKILADQEAKAKKEKAVKEKEKTAAYKFGSNILPGAGLGAALGGLYGLASPGDEEEYDETGRLIRKQPRSRLSAMLRGAVGGGLLGGAGGVVADHYAPNASSNAYDFARGLFTGKSQRELTRGDNVAKLTPMGQSVDRQAMSIGRRNNPNAMRAFTMRNGVNPFQPPAKNEARFVSLGPNGFEIDNVPDITLPAAQ
jgi:hypothetical protein